MYRTVAIYKSIKVHIAIGIISRLRNFVQMDVKTNFLNRFLERKVYTVLPKGLVNLKNIA